MKNGESVFMPAQAHIDLSYGSYSSDSTMNNNVTGSVTSTLSDSIDDLEIESDTVGSETAVDLPNSSKEAGAGNTADVELNLGFNSDQQQISAANNSNCCCTGMCNHCDVDHDIVLSDIKAFQLMKDMDGSQKNLLEVW